MQLKDLLSNYTVPSLANISNYLTKIGVLKGKPPLKKKELVKLISTAIKANIDKIVRSIKDKTIKDALNYLIEHHGIVDFNEFVLKYGSDEHDTPLWGSLPPKSVLGKLKLMGIVFVGKYNNKTTVLIPNELVKPLARYLKS